MHGGPRVASGRCGTVTVNCADSVTLICPAQAHISLQPVSSAGRLAIVTVGVPGSQGATITGMHGIGVSAPKLAGVAAATRLLAITSAGTGAAQKFLTSQPEAFTQPAAAATDLPR